MTNMTAMFNRCYVIKDLELSGFDTSRVTNMRSIFQGCYVVENLDVSGFDTSKVTDMSYMFNNCNNVKALDVSRFDTRKVTNMRAMFQSCYSVEKLDVGGFDTSHVTDMSFMFNGCTGIHTLEISDWNVSKVTSLKAFLQQKNGGNPSCKIKELDLSGWDVSSVKDLSWTFYGMANLETIHVATWDTSNVENFRQTFSYCKKLVNFDCSDWDVSSAWSIDSMLHFTGKRIYDVSKWDTSNCLSFAQLFESCANVTEIIGLENLDTSSGKKFYQMFAGCTNLTKLDLSNFDLSALDENWIDPDVGKKEDTTIQMFTNTKKLQELKVGDKFVFRDNMGLASPSEQYIIGADGHWYSENTGIRYAPTDLPSNVADTYRAVRTAYAESRVLLNGTDFNALIPKEAVRVVFTDVAAPEGIVLTEVSELNDGSINAWLDGTTYYVSTQRTGIYPIASGNCGNMFAGCNHLKEIDFTGLDFSNVFYTRNMFKDCSKLTAIDLSTFDVTNIKVTNMSDMFGSCDSIITAYGRTNSDVSKLNSTSGKPTHWEFIVKE